MIREPLWFEDLKPGLTHRTAGATLTESAILDFALHWDPQPFHLDAEAAKASIYGGLIASGFQTMMIAFRLWQAEKIMNPSSQGSPGIDALRWIRPVRPGDTIAVEAEVASARVSASRPALGVVEWKFKAFNQREEVVMTWRNSGLFLRRPENRPPETPDA